MKRGFRGLISLALACAVAAGSLIAAASAHVAYAVVASCRDFKNTLVDSFMALATQTPGQPEAVPFARAKEFRARIEKRERPVVTGAWRMCPSI